MDTLLTTRKFSFILFLVAALPFIRLAAADDVAFSNVKNVTDQELDQERGGFTTKDGFVSFGIERAIYINNQLQLRSVDDQYLPTILPNAHGNSALNLLPSQLPGGIAVIQNNLDNQLIQNVTTINATVANMNIFRQMNLSSTILNQQLVNLMR